MIPVAILTLRKGRVRFSCLCALVWFYFPPVFFPYSNSSLSLSAHISRISFTNLGHSISNVPSKTAAPPPRLRRIWADLTTNGLLSDVLRRRPLCGRVFLPAAYSPYSLSWQRGERSSGSACALLVSSSLRRSECHSALSACIKGFQGYF